MKFPSEADEAGDPPFDKQDELFNLMFKNKSAIKKSQQKKYFKDKARIKQEQKSGL